MTSSIDSYEELLKDPFIHELNGSKNDNFNALWQEIKKQVREQIIAQFRLENYVRAFKFQDGGDVDTVHNVYNGVAIKNNDARERQKENIENYDTKKFHNNEHFKSYKKDIHTRRNNGEVFTDQATGKKFSKNQSMHVDHIIPGKKFSEDPGIALAGLNPEEIANRNSNYSLINEGVNLSKGAKTNSEYAEQNEQRVKDSRENIAKLNPNDPDYQDKLARNQGRIDADPERLRAEEQRAEAAKNKEVSQTYYNSGQFKSDTLKAAGKRGAIGMMEQAWGALLFELQETLLDDVWPLIRHWKDYSGQHIEKFKEIMVHVKQRLKELKSNLLSKMADGFISNAISSIVTTLTNIFATTVSNIGRIIKDGVFGLFQGIKLLITNPNHLSTGKLVKQVLIILTGAITASLGIIFSEYLALHLQLLGPTVARLVGAGISAIVTGIITAIIVYCINSFGSILSNFFQTWHYALGVSSQEIKMHYQNAVSKIDESYQQLLQVILEKYNRLNRLGDLAHDMSLAANAQLENSVRYAEAAGVESKDILRTDSDLERYLNS